MRRHIILSTAIVVLLVILITSSGMYLAARSPFHPGSPFFLVQDTAEQLRVGSIRNQHLRTEYLVQLVERRARDIVRTAGQPDELLAFEALREAFDRALLATSQIPASDIKVTQVLLTRIIAALNQALSAAVLAPKETADLFALLQSKTAALEALMAAASPRRTW
jgi:hypothetical protein